MESIPRPQKTKQKKPEGLGSSFQMEHQLHVDIGDYIKLKFILGNCISINSTMRRQSWYVKLYSRGLFVQFLAVPVH